MLKAQGRTEEDMQRDIRMFESKLRAVLEPDYHYQRSNTEYMANMRLTMAQSITEECDRKMREKEIDWSDRIRECELTIEKERQALSKFQHEDLPHICQTARQSKREMMQGIKDEATKEKLSALEDFSMGVRQETSLLRLENSIFDLQNIQCHPEADLSFYRDCIDEMEAILKLERELEQAEAKVSSTYEVDQLAAQVDVSYDAGMARASQRLQNKEPLRSSWWVIQNHNKSSK